MMNIQREKDLLINRIQQVDDLSLLESTKEFLDHRQKLRKESEKIVVHTSQRSSLAQENPIEEAKQAGKNIQDGRIGEHEALKEENVLDRPISKWAKASKRIRNSSNLNLQGYSKQIKKQIREFREDFEWKSDL